MLNIWGSDGKFQQRILQSDLNSGRDAGITMKGPKVPILKRTEVSLSYVQHPFLYLVYSINVSIFHITWPDTFWTYYSSLEKKEILS